MSCFTFDALTSPVTESTCSGVPTYNVSEAISGCSADGKHLAIPRNLDEMDTMIPAIGSICPFYWIGCSDDIGGSYQCIDDTPIMSDGDTIYIFNFTLNWHSITLMVSMDLLDLHLGL